MFVSSCVVSPVAPAVPYPPISYRIPCPSPSSPVGPLRRPAISDAASVESWRHVIQSPRLAARIGFLIAERGVSASIPITAPPLRYRPL